MDRRAPLRLLEALQHGLGDLREQPHHPHGRARRDHLSRGWRARLATPAKLEEAAAIFREELADALKDVLDREADLRKALKAAETEAANFVRAIAEGVNARSITEALTAAEAKRDGLRAEPQRLAAVPRPSDIEIHLSAVREPITHVGSALSREGFA